MMSRKLLFSVTAKDCDFDYFRGTGKGGQKRNKTSSGARCVHKASGATGVSDDTRSQHQNKRIAFKRMAESAQFKKWHKMEVARRLGVIADVNDRVDAAMQPHNVRVEVKSDAGTWVEA